MRIKFVTTRIEIFNKGNTTKDFGGIEKGLLPGNNILKGDLPLRIREGIRFRRYVVVRTTSAQKSLGTFIWSIRAQAIARISPFLRSTLEN